jgi:glycosyltransferase involved in cell wall biosynthesis
VARPWVFSNHGLRRSGGIEQYLLTLIEALHAQGQRPTVVVRRLDASLPAADWVDAVRVRTFGLPASLRDIWFDRRLQALKRQHGWFPLIALNQTGAADIAICGSNHPAFLAAMGQTERWPDRWAVARERSHLRRARIVIAHSQLLADQAVRLHGIAADKIVVAHPPVDDSRFSPVSERDRVALRQKLGLPTDRAVFLLASTGHARKGLDLALQALGHSKEPVLLVVTGRPVTSTAPNLRYLGYRSDMEDVYRAVDCTVMASRYEPFGLVGVESVLCGTPVIGAQGVGCLEVIKGPALLPFCIDVDAAAGNSLQAALQLALQRWRQGGLRVDVPRDALAYDPSPAAHLAVLQHWVERLRSDAGFAQFKR